VDDPSTATVQFVQTDRQAGWHWKLPFPIQSNPALAALLSDLTMAVLEEQAMTLVNAVQQHLDRVVSPSTRREAWERTSELAARRPGAFVCFSFLLFPPSRDYL
jgi:hypothetical protein